MRILSAKTTYDADKITLERQGITSAELMERAAVQVFNWMHSRMQGMQAPIHIFCGVGNNGGDGLVVARHLQENGYVVSVYIVEFSPNFSGDFLINLERLRNTGVSPHFIKEGSAFPQIGREDILVDAIFGIGLNRRPPSWIGDLIREINRSRAFVLSVDIPSGLFMEQAVTHADEVVKATVVLAFQTPKLVFFLPQTGAFVTNWEVLDIGLDADFIREAPASYELIGKSEILDRYRPREKFAHKGTYGHVMIIGGSYGKIGAVILAAKGSLYAGCGLVTTFVPQCGYLPLQSAFPEAMVLTDRAEREISNMEFQITPTVIGVGMGMGTAELTVAAFRAFLKRNKQPLVVDADGLNILSQHPELLGDLPSQTVLTPHPKELERLIGSWTDDFEKLQKTKAFSQKYNCIIVIKGAHTITVQGMQGYINTSGNPGMATAGSGDVLTGVICGLLAQGYPPLEAAVCGVYLHGRAADLAVGACGYEALVASTLIGYLGKAYLDLFQEGEGGAQ